jgi:AraC family transcriptional regulator, arabinose operon regulatory protein
MNYSHIISLGYAKIGNAVQHQHHTHNENVISLITKGSIVLDCGEEINLVPGMAIVIPAGVPHKTLQGENVEFFWLSFCSGCLDLDNSPTLLKIFNLVQTGAVPVWKLAPTEQKLYLSLITNLQQEIEQGSNLSLDVISSYLTLLLHQISRGSRLEFSNNTRSDIVADALTFIQQSTLNHISLRDVANQVNKSEGYLASLVKKSTGFTVGEWIRKSRLTEACKHLLHTQKSIEDIADQTGWNDTTHFIRQFKKEFNTTPAKWRKSNLSKPD